MKFKDRDDDQEQENKDIVQSQGSDRIYNSVGECCPVYLGLLFFRTGALTTVFRRCSITAASVMEQVAAVLDALSDAKETTRQQVIGLVERIALRLEKVESKNQQLVQENELLKDQLNRVGYRSESSGVRIRKG